MTTLAATSPIKPFRPMLADNAVLDKLTYPLLASPKLDGIRAVVRGGVVWSRSNKPIPNKHVQYLFARLEGFDGELIVGDPTDKLVYRNTISGVMSVEGTPDVSFFVFDHVGCPDAAWWQRVENLFDAYHVVVLEQRLITEESQLLTYEDVCLAAGYEGLILRNANAPYKQGRSTVREGFLLKLKRFVDSEAVVVGWEERMRNDNEATTDELGFTSRTSHASGKVGHGDLGALMVDWNGLRFYIGSGFTQTEREDLWATRDVDLVGRVAKFKYFPVGGYDLPRHPVFLGFRDKGDM